MFIGLLFHFSETPHVWIIPENIAGPLFSECIQTVHCLKPRCHKTSLKRLENASQVYRVDVMNRTLKVTNSPCKLLVDCLAAPSISSNHVGVYKLWKCHVCRLQINFPWLRRKFPGSYDLTHSLINCDNYIYKKAPPSDSQRGRRQTTTLNLSNLANYIQHTVYGHYPVDREWVYDNRIPLDGQLISYTCKISLAKQSLRRQRQLFYATRRRRRVFEWLLNLGCVM